jgi:hypothetical protein
MKNFPFVACGLLLGALSALGVAQDHPKKPQVRQKKTVVRRTAKVEQRPQPKHPVAKTQRQDRRPQRPQTNQDWGHNNDGHPKDQNDRPNYSKGRPVWGRPPVYTGNWGGRPGWNQDQWRPNTLISEWSGTRSGRGPFSIEGRRTENISDVSVQVQRDRDVTIRLRTSGRDIAFTGKARKQGESLYVDIRGGGGLGTTEGTARIYLNKQYGDFFKVTGNGRLAGRRFSFTFDDWN